MAPSFSAESVAGKPVSFPADYRGRLVLLDFWATWCGPCRAEIPGLVQAQERYRGRGLTLLGLALERPNTSPGDVERFARERNMTWPHVVRGADAIARAYGVDGIPAAYLVDGDTGVVLAQGDELRGSALAETIERHLAGRKDLMSRAESGR